MNPGVAVFVDLHRKTHELKRQAEFLKEAEVLRRENEVLRDAMKARDKFLSIVSHELKTPMTPLSLQLQFFQQLLSSGTLQSFPEDRLRRMLQNSYFQLERLSKLIQELLDFSRISAGELSLIREETDLAEIVSNVLEAFSGEIARVGSQIQYEAPTRIRGFWDKTRLKYVVVNLLSNALQFGLGKPIQIQVSQDQGLARLTVVDSGIGIDPELHNRIFQSFEHAISSKHSGGLGLGLYITRQIVVLHGGIIRVESRKGFGSSFIVELPLNELPIC